MVEVKCGEAVVLEHASGVVSLSQKIEFKELKEVDLNTVSELHALFPHWKQSSVQRKINDTISGMDKRFVALVDGKISAHVRVVFGKGLHKHRAELFSLIVAPKHRHHGLGFHLMDFVLKNLPSSTKLVLLSTGSKNKPAIHLYKKLGFKKYGLLKKASIVNGRFVDNYLMCKELP